MLRSLAKGGKISKAPFGPAGQTVAGGDRIRCLLDGRKLSTVCGYNYVIGYEEWKRRLEAGPLFGGY